MQYQQNQKYAERNNSRERKGNLAAMGEASLGGFNNYKLINNPQRQIPQPSTQTNYNSYNQYGANNPQNYKTQYPVNSTQQIAFEQNTQYNQQKGGFRSNSIENNYTTQLKINSNINSYAQRQTASNEEIRMAQNSLRLLKAKMSLQTFDYDEQKPYQQNIQDPQMITNKLKNLPPRSRNVKTENQLPQIKLKPQYTIQSQEIQEDFQVPQTRETYPKRSKKFVAPLDQGNDELPAYSQGNQLMPVQEFDVNFNKDDLLECPEGCGRRFIQQALDKHTNICKKVFQQKRKQFDMKSQRIVDDEQLEQNKQNDRQKKPLKGVKQQLVKAIKSNKWKLQSEGFRAMMKVSSGEEITKEQQAAIDDANDSDKLKCDYCGRKFNETAGKRHIPICKEKTYNQEMKNKNKINLTTKSKLK